MPPKIYLNLPSYHGDFRAMPAFINGVAGEKWVSVYPENWRQSLPCVMATIILCDPSNGRLLAVMDGTYITELRTGAASGVATKYLARKDATEIGIIGTGVQARTQLCAILEACPDIRRVKVYDINQTACQQFATEMKSRLGLEIAAANNLEAACDVDVLVTTTPAREPIVFRNYIRPGTHINAIGADAQGKQELDAQLLKDAKVIVDDLEQAVHSGEINVPMSKDEISLDHIYGKLGDVVAGTLPGRQDDAEITIFDSTGLSIQDIVCAEVVYRKAIQRQVQYWDYD